MRKSSITSLQQHILLNLSDTTRKSVTRVLVHEAHAHLTLSSPSRDLFWQKIT